MKKQLKFIGFVAIATLLLLELGLRASGLYQTRQEKKFGTYVQRYGVTQKSWYHVRMTNNSYKAQEAEFSYTYDYNELGHRTVPFHEFLKDSAKVKFVFLGDSFMEGAAAPDDSSWANHFTHLITTDAGCRVASYNAGAAGSDVFFDAKMLNDKLLVSHPDHVIESLNSSDIRDVIYRGGDERFQDDGSLKFTAGPEWEPLYAYCHVFRAIVHTLGGYDSNLMKKKDLELLVNKAIDLIKARVQLTAELCNANNITYILVMHPVPGKLKFDWYDDSSEKLEAALGSVADSALTVINLHSRMFTFYKDHDVNNYSWSKNGHFNARGYAAMAEMVFDEIDKQRPDLLSAVRQACIFPIKEEN